jgi:hypothetical protein
MSPLEQLLAIADAETIVLARNLIGRDQLAILIAKAALDGTTIKIRPGEAANVLEMPKSTAAAAIDRTGFKKPSRAPPMSPLEHLSSRWPGIEERVLDRLVSDDRRQNPRSARRPFQG